MIPFPVESWKFNWTAQSLASSRTPCSRCSTRGPSRRPSAESAAEGLRLAAPRLRFELTSSYFRQVMWLSFYACILFHNCHCQCTANAQIVLHRWQCTFHLFYLTSTSRYCQCIFHKIWQQPFLEQRTKCKYHLSFVADIWFMRRELSSKPSIKREPAI